MGAIKDIVDLAKDLESRAKDRQDMEVIHKIQALSLSLQSHEVEVVERDIRVMEENAELKRQLSELQSEEIRIHRAVEFRRGKRTCGKWLAFCPKCHLPAVGAEAEAGSPLVFCSGLCGWSVYPPVTLEQLLAVVEKDS